MKKILLILAILLLISSVSFAVRDTTTDLGIYLPTWDEEDPEYDILVDLIANWNIVEDFANDPLEFDTGTRLETRVNTVLSTWVGTTSITTLGTITTGVWTGTAIADAYISNTLTVTGYMQDEDINTFAELDAWVTDQTLIHSGVTTLSSLVSVGTIGTGVWQGTAIADTYISNTLTVTGYMEDTDINTFTKIQSWVTDKVLVNTADTATIDGVWTFIGNPVIRTVSDTATAPPLLSFQKRDVTGDDVDQGDYLLKLNAYGYHGSAYHLGATVRVIVDATPGDTTDMPARICFLTSADGSATPTLRMGIFSDGDIYMGDGAWTKFFKVNSVGTVWQTSSSTATSGDVTNLRTILTCNAASGGNAASGQNTRAIYAQVVAGASKQAGLLQAGLFTASTVAGSVTAYNVHVLCAHYSSGTSTTIGGDLYVGYLRAQTRETTGRSVTGNDCILALENEAVQGAGQIMDSAIRIFENVSGNGFVYGIDMSSSNISTADIILQNGEIIENITDGKITFTGILTGNGSGLTGLSSGFTTFAEFDEENTWNVYYSDGSGDITELSLGANGKFLMSNGEAAAPTFETATVGALGDLTDVGDGTPTNTYALMGDGDSWESRAIIDADVSNTLTASILIPAAEVDFGAHSAGFTQQAVTGSDTTTTINWTLGNKFFFTFGAMNETLTFTAPTNPCNLLLVVKQDGVGSRTMTWPTILWVGGAAPTLTTAAAGIDIIALYYDGTSYYGIASLAFATP